MHINFKNVLAGLGTGVILIVSLGLGLLNFANFDLGGGEIYKTDSSLVSTNSDFIFNSDASSGDLAEDSLDCGLVYTYDGYNGKNFSLDVDYVKRVAFDANDNMYVPEEKQIAVFDKNGKYKISLFLDGGIIWDLAIHENHLYFLLELNRTIYLEKYTIEPNFKRAHAPVQAPQIYLALNKNDGYIYTSAWTSRTINQRVIDDLSFIGSFKHSDIQTQDIFFDNVYNLIYVLDVQNLVKVYDKDGQFIYSFGASGDPGVKLEGVISIVVDNSGNNLYVAESTGKVKKFSLESGRMKYAGAVEVFKQTERNNNEISSVELDSDGNLYVIHRYFTTKGYDDYVVIKKYTPPCAKITIKKEVLEKTDTSFPFTADFYGAGNPGFSLRANTNISYNTFNLSNSITEIVPIGFKLLEAKCFDSTGVEYGGLSGQTLNFTLDNFKDLICTFKNECVNQTYCAKIFTPQQTIDDRE